MAKKKKKTTAKHTSFRKLSFSGGLKIKSCRASLHTRRAQLLSVICGHVKTQLFLFLDVCMSFEIFLSFKSLLK